MDDLTLHHFSKIMSPQHHMVPPPQSERDGHSKSQRRKDNFITK